MKHCKTSKKTNRRGGALRWLLIALCLLALLAGSLAQADDAEVVEEAPQPTVEEAPQPTVEEAPQSVVEEAPKPAEEEPTQSTVADVPLATEEETPLSEPEEQAPAAEETTPQQSEAEAHVHALEHFEAKAATCKDDGNSEYWYCVGCGTYFGDAEGSIAIEKDSWVIPASAAGHDLVYVSEVAATCKDPGVAGHYECLVCWKLFSDETATVETTAEALAIPVTEEHTWDAGTVTKEPTTAETGIKIFTCAVCGATLEEPIEKLPIPKYKVTFYDEDGATPLKVNVTLEDGSVVEMETVEYDENTPVENIFRPVAPAKDGFLFLKWVSAADGVSDLAAVTADAAYKASYENLTKTSADGLYVYRLNPEKTEAAVLGWNGTDDGTGVIVPAQLDGVNVVAIGAGAFQNSPNKGTLTQLDIPAGVTAIGDAAFADCPALVSLTLPDTLEPDQVGQNIILNDTALTSLALRCTQTTALSTAVANADTFTRTVSETAEDGSTTEISKVVTLPMGVTDIIVTKNLVQENPASLTVNCPFTVQKDHSVLVDTGATLTNAATMTNFGTITNNGGTFDNANGILQSCAGTIAGDITGGTYRPNGSHSFIDGKCSVCGTADTSGGSGESGESGEVLPLKINYKGKAISKVYDRTRNVTLSASDFAIEDTHGLNVKISSVSGIFDKADAGNRTVDVTLRLSGDDAALYGSSAKTTVSGTIEPKVLTVTPFENDTTINPKKSDGTQDKTVMQKKTYGDSDRISTYGYHGSVSGLLNGDTLSGKLTRETGENVGKYRILKGTFGAGDNYTVNVLEGYFVIEPRSINAADVGLVTIGNQRYTGEAVKPAITVTRGRETLKEGTDFKVEYKDNVQPGTATVTLTGIGNYTGTRQTQFRILNIASGVSTGGGGGSSYGSGSSSYSYDGFDDGEGDSEEDDEEEDEVEPGRLELRGDDYGTILFNAAGRPMPFVQYEEPVALSEDEEASGAQPLEWILTIIPDPLYDEETGEDLLMDDGERSQYDELHLRLESTLIDNLIGMGYTELVYELENVDVRIPINALLPEIPLEDDLAAEVISVIEGEEDENGQKDKDIEELEVDLTPQTLQVQAYDICVEQVEMTVPTEREQGILENYEPIVPFYRVRVRAVILDGEETAEVEAIVTTDENGDTIVKLPETQKLPAQGYPEGVVLNVLPLEELPIEKEDPIVIDVDSELLPDEEADDGVTLEGALAVYVSNIEDAEDPDIVEETPARFVWLDDMLYGQMKLTADGIYGIGYLASDEGELEDLGEVGGLGGGFGALSSIGSSFSVDENGNPIMN